MQYNVVLLQGAVQCSIDARCSADMAGCLVAPVPVVPGWLQRSAASAGHTALGRPGWPAPESNNIHLTSWHRGSETEKESRSGQEKIQIKF